MNTGAIVAALLLHLVMPNELAYGQANGCPEEGNDRARAQVISMLDDRQDILQRDGIDASPSELRLMTNDQDPDACAEIAGPALTQHAEAEDGYRYNLFFYATNHHHYKVNQLRQPAERLGDAPPPRARIGVHIGVRHRPRHRSALFLRTHLICISNLSYNAAGLLRERWVLLTCNRMATTERVARSAHRSTEQCIGKGAISSPTYLTEPFRRAHEIALQEHSDFAHSHIG